MASLAPAFNQTVNVTKATQECVYITTHYHMGIGRMRQISLDTKNVTTADASELRHQKRLIDSPELDAIRSQDGFMQRHIDSVTCACDKSTRFLPKPELAKLYKALVAYQTIRRPKLVDAFMAKYEALEAADFTPLAEVLGDKFDRADYPKADTVRAGFYMTFRIRPVGSVNLEGCPDFVIAMELEKELSERTAAIEAWKDTLRLAGLAAVETLAKALSPDPDGKRKKLYESNVENLKQYLDTFTNRDLASDIEYQKTVVEPLKAMMRGVSIEKLRESDNLKVEIAAKLEGIKKNASRLVQVTGRKIR
jgi:hypothetical protein